MGNGRSLSTEVPSPIEPVDLSPLHPKGYTWTRASITQSYILGRVIGHGHFSTVRLATKDGFNYAIKTLDKRKFSGQQTQIISELDIVSSIDHPNIIRFYEVYEDERYVHIVMEYCSGGELFDRLISQGQLREDYVQKLARQMLAAITYLHRHNICHRDIKPENFLFETNSPEAELKIIDFGLSKKLGNDHVTMHTKAGTSVYMSPEVFEGNYDMSCDVWSFGVTLYIMLSGRMPFPDLGDALLYDYISSMRYSLDIPEFSHVSKCAKQLILKLMCPKALRYTSEQALKDPWFSMYKPQDLNPDVVRNLIAHKADNKFKREAMEFLVHRLSENQLHRLRDTFETLDESQNGFVTANELEKALRALELNISHEEITNIVSRISYGNTGKINYTEFLIATFSAMQTTSEEMLWITFKHFDKDDSGYITAADLREVGTRDGRTFTDEEVNDVIQQGTQGTGNQLNFEMFCRLMRESR